MRVEEIDITPELAKAWLEKNTGNFRTLDLRRKNKYRDEMTAGNWQMNGETIKFNGTQLLDGQHRLLAIVESGRTITSLVVFDMICDARTIDRGKPRTIAQWLHHEKIKNANAVAATSRSVVAHSKGLWANRSWRAGEMTDSEIIDFAQSNKDKLQDCFHASQGQGFIGRTLVMTIYFIGSGDGLPTENETCNWFAEKLKTGEDLKGNQPVFHLRNRFLGKSGIKAKDSPFMKRMLATIAWNKTVMGQEMNSLRLRLSGPALEKPPEQILVAGEIA